MRLNLSFDASSEDLLLNPESSEGECGILLIEDEPIWRQIYKINLFKDSDRQYKFYEADNGRKALSLLAQYSSQIKIIILDLVMPQMEGREFLEYVADKWGIEGNLGIFVLTAYGDEETMQQSQLRGVRAFIDKQNIDFVAVSDLIEQFLNFIEKPKGVQSGFYLENRPQNSPEEKSVYLRWQNGEKWESFCLGDRNEIEAVDLPNLRTKNP